VPSHWKLSLTTREGDNKVMMKLRTLRLASAAMLLAAMTGSGQAVQASGTLWYNGDSDGRDALLSATNLASTFNGGTLYNSFVYDDFIVPTGQTWTVTGVFSNIQITNFTTVPTTATWAINSGMSAGNAGTVVASGDASATLTPTGGPVIAPNLVAYTASETISPVVLTAGTYWLTNAPDIPSPFFFANALYISTTSGANAIGMPPGNDGNSFINTVGLPPALSFNYTPTSDPSVEGPGTWDYSMGVTGTFTSVTVPEPSTAILGGFALGVCCLSVIGRRLIFGEPRRFAAKQ
jgi:hypothetical protein